MWTIKVKTNVLARMSDLKFRSKPLGGHWPRSKKLILHISISTFKVLFIISWKIYFGYNLGSRYFFDVREFSWIFSNLILNAGRNIFSILYKHLLDGCHRKPFRLSPCPPDCLLAKRQSAHFSFPMWEEKLKTTFDPRMMRRVSRCASISRTGSGKWHGE